MKKMTGNYGAKETQHSMKSYQPGLLAYQEIKTPWGNRNTKVSWNMQLRTGQNNSLDRK